MKNTTSTCDLGIQVEPDKVRTHSVVEVNYNGILAQSGADEVYIHCGSSYTNDWHDVQDVKMTKKTGDTFTANILVQDGSTFNLCFRDSSNNWDNNSGENYTFKIID